MVSPCERGCGRPSQEEHRPWPWQDPHSYFGPLCYPMVPRTSGDPAQGVLCPACLSLGYLLLRPRSLHLVGRHRLEVAPRRQNAFPRGQGHLTSWQRKELPSILALSLCPSAPGRIWLLLLSCPVRGEGDAGLPAPGGGGGLGCGASTWGWPLRLRGRAVAFCQTQTALQKGPLSLAPLPAPEIKCLTFPPLAEGCENYRTQAEQLATLR